MEVRQHIQNQINNAIQTTYTKTEVDTKLNLKQNTLQVSAGKTGEVLLENSNTLKRLFAVSPVVVNTYLNVNNPDDPNKLQLEISLNQSALFNQLYHCGGIITSDGTITLSKGVGFTVSKTSLGVYNITYNSPHPSSTYLVSTSINTTTRVFLSCNNITNESIRFNGLNTTGGATDIAFHFQVFL